MHGLDVSGRKRCRRQQPLGCDLDRHPGHARSPVPLRCLRCPACSKSRTWPIRRLLRAVALLSLPVAAVFGTMSYLLLLVAATILGCGSVLFQVAYQSLTPLLVEDIDLLRSANTRLTASDALALIGGPALAGLLAGTIGAARALAVDAASYLVSAGTLTALRAPADRPARSQSSMRAEIHAGLRYVLGNAPLRAVLWSSMLFNAGLAGYEALLVVFAIQHLGLSPAVLGLAVGIGGTGVPIGLLLSGPVERRLGVGPSSSSAQRSAEPAS